MKKITLTIGTVSREANANEYPLRYEPKSDAVKAQANGNETNLRFTNGKGKSALNNFYLYWVEGKTMFYTRTNAAETEAMRKQAVVIKDATEPSAVVDAPVAAPAVEAPKAEPKPTGKRQRAPKATATA